MIKLNPKVESILIGIAIGIPALLAITYAIYERFALITEGTL